MRRTLAALLLALVTAAPLGAQSGGGEPPRPVLAPGTDTLSAWDYHQHGINVLEKKPKEAADAFYWAARLDPTWADPLYGRRIALHMSDGRRLERYLDGNRRTIESREVQQIDSLQYRALMLNPFLYRKLDRQLFRAYMRASYEGYMRRTRPSASIDYALLDYWINDALSGLEPGMRAWAAYSQGRFPDALRLYGQALKRSRYKSDIHADRGRIFFMIGNADSARAEMTRAVEQMRERDRKDLVFLYESKALYEHSIGMIQEQRGDRAAAREAYARALQEDLAYYPAHSRLALLALAEGDTTTALGEMDLAVQIQGDDAGLRYTYAQTLIATGRMDEAAAQLREAIRLEPYYAAPYHLLARVLDAQGNAEAIEQYRAFLVRAGGRNPQRAAVVERLDALGVAP